METEDDAASSGANTEGTRVPGILICFSGGAPRFEPMPLWGRALEIGRDALSALGVDDARASQRHLRVDRGGEGLCVADLGSTNGTWADGVRLAPGAPVAARVVRLGRTLLLLEGDLAPHRRAGLAVRGGLVLGPHGAAIEKRVSAFARAGDHVLFTGETGSGKEVMARAYHAASGRGDRPFIAVNCAAIPRELAERLLFGAVRGAYSGATNAPGYFQAAHGGTLFLDEVGELDPALQPKLLRALEEREVTPLGATRPAPIDVRICFATSRDLRRAAARGAFGSDLFFRIARPEVHVPPLRERPEEIPWHVERAVRGVEGAADLVIGASFVEACLLRPWPGNVRELAAEARTAAVEAIAAGRAELSAEHLPAAAGRALDEADAPEPSLDAAAIRKVVEEERGNLSRVAERLSIPRTTLRRLLDRFEIDADAARAKRG